ncbi:MAG: ATP-binding protein [Candidatus Gastranaerophilales bacterium]|nr:ATP-binding protein [Candidatus Gastranaerophilales bacterium]
MLNTLELKASIENFAQLSDRWHNIAASWDLNSALINKIDVCLEEIYVNIASYAYDDKEGTAKISFDKQDNEITLKFEDEGIYYNPLQKEDPDITLSLEERPIGGLGIFMVKEMSKDIEYKREDNKNILILKFGID